MAEKNIIPREASKVIHAKADFDVNRVLEIEKLLGRCDCLFNQYG